MLSSGKDGGKVSAKVDLLRTPPVAEENLGKVENSDQWEGIFRCFIDFRHHFHYSSVGSPTEIDDFPIVITDVPPSAAATSENVLKVTLFVSFIILKKFTGIRYAVPLNMFI